MIMFKGTILYAPRSDAVVFAADYLSRIGLTVTTGYGPDVTHLLLPVPSFPNGDEYLAHMLAEVPDDVIISGGNLRSPLLEHSIAVDFLQDPFYLAENAAITADCAVELAEKELESLDKLPVLILGWGRIGKCLSYILKSTGCKVTIATRKISDLAMIHALGFGCESIYHIRDSLDHYRLIINTVPELIHPNAETHPDCLILELASKPGITGGNIINARGLPGKMAPQRSGELIAKTFLRLSI